MPRLERRSCPSVSRLTRVVDHKEFLFKPFFHAQIARYMSPEVARSMPANESADCYSFAMVMWEMVSLELPFQFYGVKELTEQ